MDAYLAVVSKREVREYTERPIPDELLTKILQSGRASGSSKNTQPWRFEVEGDRIAVLLDETRDPSPMNSGQRMARIALGAALENRVAQNMMISAWALGVGSCPNSVRPDQHDAMRADLGIPSEAAIATVITLGYPAPGQPRPRAKADPEKVLARVNRLPLDEIVGYERFKA